MITIEYSQYDRDYNIIVKYIESNIKIYIDKFIDFDKQYKM